MALPSGYMQAEYIETSGTQYFDTGYIPNQNTRLVMDVYPLSISDSLVGTAYKGLFGCRRAMNTDAFGIWIRADGIKPNYNDSALDAYLIDIHPVQRLQIDMSPGKVTVNGISKTTTTATFTTQYPLILFSYNSGGTIDERMTDAKLYSCQIYESGTLVRDFVPCVVKSSGVVGLYDTVSGSFYEPIGSGSVIAHVTIPMNWSENIDGVVTPIVGGYENVDGVPKRILRTYENVGGVIVPTYAEKNLSYDLSAGGYTWKKYSVVETVGAPYTEVKESTTATVFIANGTKCNAAATYSFDSSEGSFKFSASLVLVENLNTTKPYYRLVGEEKNVLYKFAGSITANLSGVTGKNVTRYKYYAKGTTTYAKGDYISDVTSSDASAYPTNGRHTDGYWYVKQ